MEFRQLKVIVVLVTALFCGAMGHAQSEPSAAKPQEQTPEIQAIPLQTEGARALPEVTTVPNVLATLGRPILFVHGWCGNDVDWSPTLQAIRLQLLTSNSSLYSNSAVYGVVFNGAQVYFYDFFTRQIVANSQIPSNSKFFVTAFIDPRQSSASAPFDPNNVAQIPISVKANELAQALSAIQDITFVRDSIVVAHSMGGLVARAYVEGLGSPLTFNGTQYLYSPGTISFAQNLGSIITVDTPHAGAPVSFSESLFGGFFPCGGSLNRAEMIPGNPSSVVETLNYVPGASLFGATARPLAADLPIRSIRSYNTFDWGGTPNSDGVVSAATQDIRLALQPNYPLSGNLQSLDNNEGILPSSFSTDCSNDGFYVLHLIKCVGVHASTLQFLGQGIGVDMLGVPLGVFSLSFTNSIVGGGSFTGTVMLTTGAPAHGATVALSSNDPSVQVPATLNIPAGVDSASFTLNSSTVGSPKTVMITAAYGRTPQNSSITLQPAIAQVGLSSTSLDFSTQLIKTRSIGHVLSVMNSGTAPLSIASIFVTGDFEQSNTCIGTFATNASCAINITFKPNTFGLGSGTLTIVDNAPGSPHNIALSGSGIDIVLTLSRPARPHRSTTPSSNVREANFELNVVGGTAAEPAELSCVASHAGDVCTLTQMDTTHWRVTVAQQQRASRLRRAQASEVTVNANLGNGVRSFSVPLQ